MCECVCLWVCKCVLVYYIIPVLFIEHACMGGASQGRNGLIMTPQEHVICTAAVAVAVALPFIAHWCMSSASQVETGKMDFVVDLHTSILCYIS